MKNYDKILYGAAGAVATSYLTYKTQFPWVKYDLQLIKTLVPLAKDRQTDFDNRNFMINRFEKHVERTPEKPFIIFEDGIYTYRFMNEQANRVASMARKWKLGVGSTVAIFIENEPAFVWTYLGMQKLGVTCALINFNLRSKALTHSLLSSEATVLIVGSGEEMLQAVEEIQGDLGDMQIFVQGQHSESLPPAYQAFDDIMLKTPPVQPDPCVRSEVTMETSICYIYTSGTTGLPKPAILSHAKIFGVAKVLKIVGVGENDIVYTPLPLYHSAGGGIGLFGVIDSGCTMVLRKKFSASHFWEDIRRHGVTIFQYIGELCRYVLSTPENPLDGVHKVKAAFGNGLRADIWEKFAQRFKVPLICEFFGATEGRAFLVNVFNKPGAIGRLSPIMKRIFPERFVLVKYDVATAEPIRDKNGRCIEISRGEAGLFISELPSEVMDAGAKFYMASKEANEKKIVRDAFKPGDAYFNYGDLFFLDRDYFLYFVDRIGDTFRWKGENVSTTEVANVLSRIDFLEDANVYGVVVPGRDGRAGMAALTLQEGVTLTPERLQIIYNVCEKKLPSYARPLFLRSLPEAHLTGTLKQRKVELIREAYDPVLVKDPVFYLDHDLNTYRPLDTAALQRLLSHSKL